MPGPPARAIDDDVAAWCARDRTRALLPADRAIVDDTAAARALVVERVRAGVVHADLVHACAMLGRLFAERGGSPTLAASTIDGLREALGDVPDALVWPARAAVAEGFAAARADRAAADAAARWEWPRCAVAIDADRVAIAAGYPEDDGEALAAWSARVAAAAARAGHRRAVLSGSDAARHALADALALAGIDVRVSSPPLRSPRTR